VADPKSREVLPVCQQSSESPPSNYHLKLPCLTQEEESMEERKEGVAFPPRVMGAADGQMVRIWCGR
jgi:hypothetical protein